MIEIALFIVLGAALHMSGWYYVLVSLFGFCKILGWLYDLGKHL